MSDTKVLKLLRKRKSINIARVFREVRVQQKSKTLIGNKKKLSSEPETVEDLDGILALVEQEGLKGLTERT